MADVQRYFEIFHEKIRLGPYDENADLREKRDMLTGELKKKLEPSVPKFESFDQGSYAIDTGTVPLDGDYDIDIGLIFDCERGTYADPVALKKLVRDALTHGNRSVRIRRPCVTVEYKRDGKVEYHVDLAVYAKRADGHGLDLARGRESDGPAARTWEQNDPKGFIEAVSGRFSGAQLAQMKRTVRYLKRWRDHKFSPEDGPASVALTTACYRWFQPDLDSFNDRNPVDIRALKSLAETMCGQFVSGRLAISLPVAPNSDLLAALTATQMNRLKAHLTELIDALKRATEEPLPEKACKILAEQFGDEFPIPDPDDTARKVKAPYVHAGTSA